MRKYIFSVRHHFYDVNNNKKNRVCEQVPGTSTATSTATTHTYIPLDHRHNPAVCNNYHILQRC